MTIITSVTSVRLAALLERPSARVDLMNWINVSIVRVILASVSCCHLVKNVTQQTGNFVLSSMPSQSIIDWF